MTRRLSRNMERVVAGKAKAAEYLASPEHAAANERHIQYLRDRGFPTKVIERYERPWEPVRQRLRRGRVVEIPEEWRGVVTRPQTIKKRPSKLVGKLRKEAKLGRRRLAKPAERAAELREDS